VDAGVGRERSLPAHGFDEVHRSVYAGARVRQVEHRSVPEELHQTPPVSPRGFIGSTLERGCGMDGGLVAALAGEPREAGDLGC
jgi:hypothetical protein